MDAIEQGVRLIAEDARILKSMARLAMSTEAAPRKRCAHARTLSVHFARQGEHVLSLYWSAYAAELA